LPYARNKNSSHHTDAIIGYALAFVLISQMPKRRKPIFNSIAFLLTFIWNVLVGILWWVTID
ncbi:hypothetical protein, partial [Bacteroides pyogenes]|uniref:hypothetical protein n=1 Tax=Bacteroides pyogenes TaxID=310300 RepID=UPI001BADF174